MGVRIIEGKRQACLYDSVTGVAFGPVFTGLDAHDQAVHFNDWLEQDARTYTPAMLNGLHAQWADENTDPEHGELTAKAMHHVVTLL